MTDLMQDHIDRLITLSEWTQRLAASLQTSWDFEQDKDKDLKVRIQVLEDENETLRRRLAEIAGTLQNIGGRAIL